MNAPAAVTEELSRLAAAGAVVIVGTSDAAAVPEVCRGWGVRVTPAGNAIEVCVYALSGRRTLENLAENPRIAVTVTSPSTYRSFQLKGHARLAAFGDEDARHVAEHQRAFVAAVASVGLPRESAARLFEAEIAASAEMARIEVAVEAVFDQTPGPGAGARL